MNSRQIIGLITGVIVLGIGVYLLNSSYNSMDGTKEKIKHKITGKHSEGVRNHLKAGTTLIILGCIVGAGSAYYFRKKHH